MCREHSLILNLVVFLIYIYIYRERERERDNILKIPQLNYTILLGFMLIGYYLYSIINSCFMYNF